MNAPAKITRVNHAAYRCRDAAQTRWFYEEVLGLKTKAAIAFDHVSGTNDPRKYMHIFFELGNGGFVAFFDSPDDASPEHFERKDSFDVHIALEVDGEEALLAMQKHIQSHGKSCLGPIDHGFVKSCYMYDPNGLQVEISTMTPQYEEIMNHEEEISPDEIIKWSERTRAQKLELFGEEALDKRA